MKKNKNILLLLVLTLLAPVFVSAQSPGDGSEVIGRWNLTVVIEDDDMEELGLFRHGLMDADGFPGWLEIKRSGFSTLVGYYVGYEGSARPISKISYSAKDGKYHFTIPPQWMDIEDIYFEFSLEDDKLTGYEILDGHKLYWTGVRAPSLERKEPPVWGNPKNLLDDNLSRWIVPAKNEFRMVDGVLVNAKAGGNLVTTERYDDFKLSVEFRYPEGSNSGIYLRGRYELQIMDDYGTDVSSTGVGGIYGFIEPSVNVAKKAGEWQSYEITLVGRHVTVVYNGVEIISNRIIPGITGGSLDSKEGNPGPIILQGDHGPVEFRKIVITPSVN
ncbi:protein of unknown function [Mariniphaga anaerophila]|uniref:3-keto-alpha-glucoside-1,2-lyase/3-keto-2-hydroxy-glucal hydratase domain-containing protein n=1 Tax=Mariniphaga anaerophila TaxID=1484053 RepID=A0A1M5E630_9BACT|nr:DUF1080 domain-containing protein [Mariniphaga anaerophila]SHF74699.1 protein of unknown function [Mariniphaga anaerophila]